MYTTNATTNSLTCLLPFEVCPPENVIGVDPSVWVLWYIMDNNVNTSYLQKRCEDSCAKFNNGFMFRLGSTCVSSCPLNIYKINALNDKVCAASCLGQLVPDGSGNN